MDNNWKYKIDQMEEEKKELIQEKEFTMNYDKIDFLDEQIKDLEHSIKIVKGYE